MARIRTVKPELFKNDELAALPVAARLLFIGLFCLSDREGRLEDRPKRIKAEIYPYDNIDVDDQLTRLQSAGFIKRYEVGEMKAIQVINFKKHQRITGSEATTPSEIPPEGGMETPRKHFGNTLETSEKHLGRQEGKEGKGKEGKEYAPTLEMELPEIDVGKAVEYISLTKYVKATPEIIQSLWTVFKAKNFTGEKKYKDERDVRSHFFNSLKYENISNATHNTKPSKSRGAAGADQLTEKLRENLAARGAKNT